MTKFFLLALGLTLGSSQMVAPNFLRAAEMVEKKNFNNSAKQLGSNIKMSDLQTFDRFRDVSPLDMPILVPTNMSETIYLISLVESSIEVITGQRVLEEDDKKFGKGNYFFPKDPSKPIKRSISYKSENFKFGLINLNFTRMSQQDNWCKSGIQLAPKNFPLGVFQMNVDKSFFKKFIFKKAYKEHRPSEQIKEVNVFLFEFFEKEKIIKIKFEARPDVSILDDKYPSSFHYILVETDHGNGVK